MRRRVVLKNHRRQPDGGGRMTYDPARVTTDLDFVEGMLHVVKGDEYTVYLLVDKHNGNIHVVNVIEN